MTCNDLLDIGRKINLENTMTDKYGDIVITGDYFAGLENKNMGTTYF